MLFLQNEVLENYNIYMINKKNTVLKIKLDLSS